MGVRGAKEVRSDKGWLGLTAGGDGHYHLISRCVIEASYETVNLLLGLQDFPCYSIG